MTFKFDDRDPTELLKRATDDSVWESNDGNVIVYIGRFGWNADYQQFNLRDTEPPPLQMDYHAENLPPREVGA